MKSCPYCGRENDDLAEHCIDCMTALPRTDASTLSPSDQLPVSQSTRPLVGGIIRDVLITFGLTALGGVFVGVALHRRGFDNPQLALLATGASTLALGSLGFIFSACKAVGNRWAHI